MQQIIALDFDVVIPKVVKRVKRNRKGRCPLSDSHRYYLHRKVKVFAAKFILKKRKAIIYLPIGFKGTERELNYLTQLIEIGYLVQPTL